MTIKQLAIVLLTLAALLAVLLIAVAVHFRA